MFEIGKILYNELSYIPVEDFSIVTDDIYCICEEYEKLDCSKEELVVKEFGKKQNINLIFFVEKQEKKVEVFVNGELRGFQKLENIQNLSSFLALVYNNPKIGNVDAINILFINKE